ncbi:MAG TPA: hypothetical protein VIJ93_05440 [bacterium]
MKLVGVTKTRMAAKRLCDKGLVLSGEKPLKPSHELVGGEILDIHIPENERKLKVLEIPAGKSVAKKDRSQFVLTLGKEI